MMFDEPNYQSKLGELLEINGQLSLTRILEHYERPFLLLPTEQINEKSNKYIIIII